MERKIALITGATSGIGQATARILAAENWNLILTGRRKERLDALVDELNKKYNTEVLALCFDVRDKQQVIANLGTLPEAWQNIDLLMNNAGLASGLEPIQDGDFEDWDKMIDTNIKGLLYVTHTVFPYLKARGKGLIINLGSIAGKETYPNGGVYCATKHAVDSLSKAMRIDMLPFGIKVSQICPGAVETEFSEVRFHGDEQRAEAVYKGFEPLHADDIAEVVSYLVNLPDHVCINDMMVLPKAQASAYVMYKK